MPRHPPHKRRRRSRSGDDALTGAYLRSPYDPTSSAQALGRSAGRALAQPPQRRLVRWLLWIVMAGVVAVSVASLFWNVLPVLPALLGAVLGAVGLGLVLLRKPRRRLR
jgi:hypothetical protein